MFGQASPPKHVLYLPTDRGGYNPAARKASKPDIKDQSLISILNKRYGLQIAEVEPLLLGADRDSEAHLAVAEDGEKYFVKLRHGAFDEISALLPKFLTDSGITSIIPPLETQDGHLWASLEPFKLIAYPFVEGLTGYEVALSEHQWNELGRVLKTIHAKSPPQSLRSRIRTETYSQRWGDALRTFLAQAHHATPNDPISAKLTRFLKAKRTEILNLIRRVEGFAEIVQDRALASVLCHSDIHAGNILVEPDGTVHIIDWDEPALAPKERDLMFIGGGYWGNRQTRHDEERFFYRGYGETEIDPFAMAYYRYGRIVEDIAVFCERILQANEGNDDREQCFRYLASNFLPHRTIEIAYASDKTSLGT